MKRSGFNFDSTSYQLVNTFGKLLIFLEPQFSNVLKQIRTLVLVVKIIHIC